MGAQWRRHHGVFVDPYAETQPGAQPGLPPVDASSDLNTPFAAWGMEFEDIKAIGDPANDLRVRREGRADGGA